MSGIIPHGFFYGIIMNIVLTGYRCCGKSSVGEYIAEKTGRKFIDTDDLIEKRAGEKIEKIILNHGWDFFRDLEKDVVREISSLDGLVIATGGGVVTNEENILNLKRNGYIVWLKCDVDVIRSRMNKDEANGDTRPSLTGSRAADEIQTVLNIREPLYAKASNMSVDASLLSIEEAADIIIRGVRS